MLPVQAVRNMFRSMKALMPERMEGPPPKLSREPEALKLSFANSASAPASDVDKRGGGWKNRQR